MSWAQDKAPAQHSRRILAAGQIARMENVRPLNGAEEATNA